MIYVAEFSWSDVLFFVLLFVCAFRLVRYLTRELRSYSARSSSVHLLATATVSVCVLGALLLFIWARRRVDDRNSFEPSSGR